MALKTERDKIAHLLRRAGLGASNAEVEYYTKMGHDGAIDALIEYDKVEDDFTLNPADLINNKGQLQPQVVAAWWIGRMMVTKRPLQEKMVLFWHDHFATSADKVKSGVLMYQQNELFRRLALADFKTILTEVSKDPAMILWLDTNTNVRGKPNENFAREVMELFTLSIGHYTETDIQEAARAFTGWTLARAPRQAQVQDGQVEEVEFTKRPRLHDNGTKTVLGKTGNFDGEDICNLLVEKPETATYLCTKLWTYFAYPKPDQAIVDRLTAKFKASNYSIKTVVREIFKSKEFYSDKAERAIYKSPSDFVIGLCRCLGVVQAAQDAGADRPAQWQGAVGILRVFGQAISRMGQSLLYPPDVSGWDGGSAWVNSATMIERIKFADLLFGNVRESVGKNAKRQIPVRGIPAARLFGDKEFRSSLEVVDRALQVLDATLPPEKRTLLAKTVTDNGGVAALKNPGEAQQIAHELSKLIFASPEFQFC
jgi:uncharacterized protein (DUF1800 family)